MGASSTEKHLGAMKYTSTVKLPWQNEQRERNKP